MQSFSRKILSRIYGKGRGWCFSQIDFTDIAPRSTVDTVLNRFATSGSIRRILRGLYDYPRFSQLLGELVAPDMQQVVAALCRKHNWKVVPDGSTALHLLGLDTQVPAQYRYLSSGPNREYTIGTMNLRFVHQKTQHTALDDHFAATVVQAILAIGKDSFDDHHRQAIAEIARDRNPQRLVKDTRQVTSWVHDEILQIARVAESQA